MINQAAKRILKALSFDGVEVDAFRHMADLKRLDPMKIFYKKIDEKIYNGSHAVPVRIFFPNEKSFQESNDKTSDSRDKKLLLFVHGGGWVTESIDNYERICARLADATGQYVAAVEYRLAPEDKFPSGLEDCYVVAKALYTGKFVLNVKPENINELVERILKRVRPIAAVRNIEVGFESFRPVTAEVDEVKLSLAISNLVENAIKYNKEDGWVHVSLNADHKYFYVKVADSGIGIPEESIEHIFERFYRVDKSHSREIGGTGLGLAIARNAIVMHRGAVKVYSEEGTGTTFTVRVPLNYIV